MRRDARERKKIIEREIAVAHGIEAVRRNAGKAELARDGRAIDSETVARKGARTHRASVGAFRSVLQASDVARESLGMRQQKMRKQNRLSVLHVRHARHRRGNVGFRLLQESVEHGLKTALNLRDGVHDKEAEIGGYEFVAAATCVQLPAERAEFVDQRAFDEMVHILGGGRL